MSVERSDYILIGVNIGQDKFDNDFFEENYEETESYFRNHEIGKIAYILDGMCGDYFIVGEIIAMDKDGYNGLPLYEFDFRDDLRFFQSRMKVKEHIKNNFNIEVEPKIIALTHWH